MRRSPLFNLLYLHWTYLLNPSRHTACIHSVDYGEPSHVTTWHHNSARADRSAILTEHHEPLGLSCYLRNVRWRHFYELLQRILQRPQSPLWQSPINYLALICSLSTNWVPETQSSEKFWQFSRGETFRVLTSPFVGKYSWLLLLTVGDW
jgi:hypothetical protein